MEDKELADIIKRALDLEIVERNVKIFNSKLSHLQIIRWWNKVDQQTITEATTLNNTTNSVRVFDVGGVVISNMVVNLSSENVLNITRLDTKLRCARSGTAGEIAFDLLPNNTELERLSAQQQLSQESGVPHFSQIKTLD